MKKLIPIAAAFTLAAGSAFAGGDNAKQFQTLDADASGAIERQELKGHPEAMKQFNEVDANANGKLEAAEFAEIELTGTADPGHSESATSHDSDSDSDSDYDSN